MEALQVPPVLMTDPIASRINYTNIIIFVIAALIACFLYMTL